VRGIHFDSHTNIIVTNAKLQASGYVSDEWFARRQIIRQTTEWFQETISGRRAFGL
jgi:hypothetical protein